MVNGADRRARLDRDRRHRHRVDAALRRHVDGAVDELGFGEFGKSDHSNRISILFETVKAGSARPASVKHFVGAVSYVYVRRKCHAWQG
jgi:hypothetical protein